MGAHKPHQPAEEVQEEYLRNSLSRINHGIEDLKRMLRTHAISAPQQAANAVGQAANTHSRLSSSNSAAGEEFVRRKPRRQALRTDTEGPALETFSNKCRKSVNPTLETTGLLNISVHESFSPRDFETEPNAFYIPEEKLASLLNPNAFSPPPTPRYILHPGSTLRTNWELFLLALLGYVCVSVPLVTCFMQRQSVLHAVIDLVVDILFMLDIALYFFTGDTEGLPATHIAPFYNSARVLCTDLKQIRWRYATSWMLPDMISSLPVQLILLADPSLAEDYVAINFVRSAVHTSTQRALDDHIRTSKPATMFTSHDGTASPPHSDQDGSAVSRLEKQVHLQYSGSMHPAAFQLAQLLMVYFLLVHTIACLYWRTAISSLDESRDNAECDAFTRDQGRIAIWAMCEDVTDSGLDRQYTRALYSVVLMMLGGDSYPASPGQEVFSSSVMLLGIFTTSVRLGPSQSECYPSDMMVRVRVDPRIKVRVREFIEYLYTAGHMNSEDTALEMEKKKPLIRAVEIFKTVSPTCIVEIVHALQQVFMPPKEYIIVQGQYGYCMYFIRRGFVQITVIQADEEVPLAQLGDGAHFGEGALVGDHQRHANVLTLTHCEMEKLDQVIAHAPHSLNLPHYKPKLLSLSGAGRTVIELYTHVWHPSDHAPPSVLIATYFYLRVASARASVMPLTACAHGQVAFEQICEKHEELAEILTERARERALTSQASFRFPKASPRASKPETKLQQARASS
ncbi:MAG: hypothetical protein SGPRY_010686, partial [Prymnesium sp.]